MAATLPTNEGHDAGVSVPWRSRLDTSRLQAHDPTFRYVRRLTSSPLPRGGADFLAPGRGSSAPIFLTCSFLNPGSKLYRTTRNS